ncbi:MAG: hypothetical protein LBR64_03825 [Dysgonamonadaceae bacterium]|jgi:hypothetical protein|nr:hypothetical protein [Dysgonamonadaceae bacterium]
MNKNIFLAILFIVLFGLTDNVNAQVTIGEQATPIVTLEVKGKPSDDSKPDGVLIPKLTGNELRAKWNNPGTYPQGLDINKSEGILVYVTEACSPADAEGDPFEYVTAPGFYFFSVSGMAWKPLVSGGETHEAAAPKVEWFYMPSTVLPVASGANSINLYDVYTQNFGMTASSTFKGTGATSLPVVPANQIEFFITYYDTQVFTNLSLTAAGVLSYDCDPTKISDNTYMNIVFRIK